MSNYDHRDKPAYRNDPVNPNYAKNRHILEWWSARHDGLIKHQIAQYQWLWYWEISELIVDNIPKQVINNWIEHDPICAKYAWYNVLMYFAMSLAEQRGFTSLIRQPMWRICPLCNNKFREDSLPYPLVQRLGIDRLYFCSPCLRDTVLQGSGISKAPKSEIIAYLRYLSDFLGKVPTQAFGQGIADLHPYSDKERLELLRLFQRKPTIKRVKEIFGSWLNALIEAGILEDGTRRTSRGIQTIAKDGHVCLSLGEKTIDDFMFQHGVEHEIEPKYPHSNYRADWKVGSTLIEYFGLTGVSEYDEKTEMKKRLCKKHNIKLIAIYPQDLVSEKRLANKLRPILT